MRGSRWAVPALLVVAGNAAGDDRPPRPAQSATAGAEPGAEPGAEQIAEQRIATSWNRHRAGGADNRRTDVRLVFVRAGESVRVFESGVDRDFSMDSQPDGPRTREAIRRWLTSWSGTWVAEGDARRLRLERQQSSCRMSMRWDRRPAEDEPCRSEAETLDLRCAPWRGTGDLADASGWRCVADGLRGHATLPWIVADRCVVVSRGLRRPAPPQPCPPEPGPPAPG